MREEFRNIGLRLLCSEGRILRLFGRFSGHTFRLCILRRRRTGCCQLLVSLSQSSILTSPSESRDSVLTSDGVQSLPCSSTYRHPPWGDGCWCPIATSLSSHCSHPKRSGLMRNANCSRRRVIPARPLGACHNITSFQLVQSEQSKCPDVAIFYGCRGMCLPARSSCNAYS